IQPMSRAGPACSEQFSWLRVRANQDILFGSEMVGAVRGIDPQTGHYFDDTKRYIDALAISDADKRKVFEGNARRVYPRLDAQLRARGL
ncbi:amidohydrolase family protein, partial [Xanthomonas citri pv. mangiferaeindicae]|uniref:amidohydrolase family protein n=1 Tax=Xanthomonas citri TaxID=346 RepID=UPI003F7A88F2